MLVDITSNNFSKRTATYRTHCIFRVSACGPSYPASRAHTSYDIFICGQSGSTLSQKYTILGQMLLNTKCFFIFSTTFARNISHSEKYSARLLLFFSLSLCSPAWAMASSSTRFLDHTQRRATVGRTLPDE
jgi:hypothetical protein